METLLRTLLRRWHRRGPPRHYGGPEVSAILEELPRLLAPDPGAEVERLRSLPPLAEPYWLPAKPTPHARLTAQADALLVGEFRPAGRWPAQQPGFPPPWDADPFDDDNWLSTLHGLEWLIPLVHAHAGDPEKGYLAACARAIGDWILRNPFRGAPSRFSWHDHASAKRLRLFAWLWEQYRGSEAFEPEFARLLLASAYQHSRYQMDERNYRPNSNHGLEGIGSLWAAALTFPFFADAPAWERTAAERLEQWIGDNLSPAGFHMEQSPSYHWFVLVRLAALDRFLRANDREPTALAEATGRAARVWPYLLKPNGVIPTVGDSSPTAPANWQNVLKWRWGREAPPPAESTAAPGRPDAGTFVICPRAGYAIMLSSPSPAAASEDDTYVLFRCRAFESPHCHYDALSFILYGLQRDWVSDSGYLSYHEWDPRRRYLRSLRAHSVVVAGGSDFRTHTNKCLEWGRTAQGDFVVSYQDLPTARHTRRLLFTPPHQLTITDHVQPARRRGFQWSQLFQLAPDLEVEIASEVEAHLLAPDGARCIIRQRTPGGWRVARGEQHPRLQGWISKSYGEWEPTTTLIFQPGPGETAVESVLTLHPPPQADPPTHPGPVT